MKSRKIRFTDKDWLSKKGDSDSLTIHYEIDKIIDDIAGISSGETDSGQLTIDISRSLQVTWGLERDTLETVMLLYAKDYAASKAGDTFNFEDEELKLTTYNAPDLPPIDSDESISLPVEFYVQIPDSDPRTDMVMTDLASDIIDLRDNINALFGEKYDGRLLSITQERALLELSRRCTSREEFAFRVSSLVGLATSIETKPLKKHIKHKKDSRPIDILKLFLNELYPDNDTSFIYNTLYKLNHIRRMYPIHTDRADGVIDAFSYFNLSYPIEDYQTAHTILLTFYRDCLKELFDLLNS